MTNKTTDQTAERQSKVKVGKLGRDQEAVTELTGSEQRQIKGGAPQTKPVGASGARHGGGCDEWGCGANHNETLVRATELIEMRAKGAQR